MFVFIQQAIREGAVEALQACLVILAQRETKEMQKRPIWYNVSSLWNQVVTQITDGVALTSDINWKLLIVCVLFFLFPASFFLYLLTTEI